VPGIVLYLRAGQDINLSSGPSRAQYQYVLKSNDGPTLNTWTQRLTEKLRANPAFRDLSNDLQLGGSITHISIDRQAAARFGLTATDVDQALYDAFGQRQINEFQTEINQYQVVLELDTQQRGKAESLNYFYLRSPLTNLIGQTQVALTRGRSAEHYFEVLQSNLEELERLRSIINDMLFLASADQGSKATKLITSSLADEVATTLDYLDFILEDAQVQVRVTGDAQVQIEKAHLRRALINLLSNAVQHTAPGQVIEVKIEVLEDHVAIGVTNPGDEIASEHLPRLFERFYRVDASRSNSGANHGLGLAIVKAIALMHGGDVFVRSEGGGNTFGITLPV